MSKRTRWLSPQRLRIALLIIIALSAFGTGINWGLPQATNPETVQPWALDAIAPIAPLNEAYNRFTRSGNEYVIYPLFHYMVLSGAYAPYVAAQYVAGNLSEPSSSFPYGIEDVTGFSQDLTLIARVVSVTMALGIVLLVYRMTLDLAGQHSAFWAALSTSLIAPLSYYAKTSNLDVPYAFWVCLAAWRYLAVIRFEKHRDYMLLGVFAALAVATKDQAYGFFVLIPFVLAYRRAKSESADQISITNYVRAMISRPIWLAGISALVAYAAANNVFLGGLEGLLRHFAWGGEVFDYRQESESVVYGFSGQMQLLGRSGLILLQMLGPASVALALAGIVFAWRDRNWSVLSLLVLVASYYVFVIAVFNLVFSRYLLIPAVLLTPFLGIAIERIFRKSGSWRISLVAVIAISLLPQAALVANLNLTLLADSRVAMSDWIRSNVEHGAVIESQVRQRMLPHISNDYRVAIAGNSGDSITMLAIDEELTPASLASRDPDYILILEGLGVTGDPAGWESPALKHYYQQLMSGGLGYEKVAEFETPYFVPFRQIPGTRPRSIMLARSRRPIG